MHFYSVEHASLTKLYELCLSNKQLVYCLEQIISVAVCIQHLRVSFTKNIICKELGSRKVSMHLTLLRKGWYLLFEHPLVSYLQV